MRNIFPGRSVVLSILTFPLAFPGVVIGFLIIMLAGRQGLIGTVTKALSGEKTVFAYSILGLFFGYLYFSIPRVILTIMAAAEKLDELELELLSPENRGNHPAFGYGDAGGADGGREPV